MLNKENKCKEKGLKSLLGPKHIWYLKAQVAKAITLILFETEKIQKFIVIALNDFSLIKLSFEISEIFNC